MVKVGDRVEITALAGDGDPQAEVGDKGIVDFINDSVFHQVFVELDKGINLALVTNKGDSFRLLPEEE